MKQPFIIVMSTGVAAIWCGSTSKRFCLRTTKVGPLAGLDRTHQVIEAQLPSRPQGGGLQRLGQIQSFVGGLQNGHVGLAD